MVISLVLKEFLERLRQREKNAAIRPRVVALIRSGDIIELKSEVLEQNDGSLIVDKKMLYKLEKPEPYILRMGSKLYRLYILDSNVNAFYRFEDPKPLSNAKINPVVLDPRVLYDYIASSSVRKLLGKITVGKGEALLYMFTGMVIVFIIIFFILPLLGHEIIIK
ncbi:MAG: hypothetical protein QXY82_01365 [Desulfurococcaceae archaeon]